MNQKRISQINPRVWELVFHIVLTSTVFVFFVFGHRDNEIEESEVMFFLNYAGAAYIINYLLLPLFLYRKKYIRFVFSVLVILGVVIILEELVIEKIYFPDTRGKGFPGIYYNLLSAMPTITILAGFKFAWDALKKQRQLEQMQRLVKESEMQFLKSQINPHFLFNNLNNLYAYALEKSEKTPEIILEMSGVLRYMLYECKEEYVPLTREVEQLGNFVNLSKLQFEDRGEVHFEIDLDRLESYEIAPLILSVFVENAFKHSSSSQSDNIRILIKLSVSARGDLIFYCENSFSAESNTDDLTRGIGLENVKKRLNILYPNAYELKVISEKDVYKVNLRIQLNKKER